MRISLGQEEGTRPDMCLGDGLRDDRCNAFKMWERLARDGGVSVCKC